MQGLPARGVPGPAAAPNRAGSKGQRDKICLPDPEKGQILRPGSSGSPRALRRPRGGRVCDGGRKPKGGLWPQGRCWDSIFPSKASLPPKLPTALPGPCTGTGAGGRLTLHLPGENSRSQRQRGEISRGRRRGGGQGRPRPSSQSWGRRSAGLECARGDRQEGNAAGWGQGTRPRRASGRTQEGELGAGLEFSVAAQLGLDPPRLNAASVLQHPGGCTGPAPSLALL